MAFSLRNLSVLSYANGFTLWHYKSRDDITVGQPGYFDGAGDMLSASDIMMVSAIDGARMLCVERDDAALRLAPMV